MSTATRGSGRWDSSLKTNGEEICRVSEHKRCRADLIRGVGDADIEEGQVLLNEVPDKDFQALGFGSACSQHLLRRPSVLAREQGADDALSLHALGELGGHARVHLDGEAVLALLQDANRQVAGAGANLEHAIGRAQVRFVDDAIYVSKSPAECG